MISYRFLDIAVPFYKLNSIADAEQRIERVWPVQYEIVTNEEKPSPKKLTTQLVSTEKGGLFLEEKNKTAAGSATIKSVLLPG